MQVADSVSMAEPSADFMTFFHRPQMFQYRLLEYMRAAHQQSTIRHVQTQLGVQSALSFLGAVIWSPWLTRFRYGDRSPKHDQASRSITELYLRENKIRDDGARALADAVKAILVRWFSNRRAQAIRTATKDTCSSFRQTSWL